MLQKICNNTIQLIRESVNPQSKIPKNMSTNASCFAFRPLSIANRFSERDSTYVGISIIGTIAGSDNDNPVDADAICFLFERPFHYRNPKNVYRKSPKPITVLGQCQALPTRNKVKVGISDCDMPASIDFQTPQPPVHCHSNPFESPDSKGSYPEISPPLVIMPETCMRNCTGGGRQTSTGRIWESQ